MLGRGDGRGWVWALPVGLTVVAADQLTKQWAVTELTPGCSPSPPANCVELPGVTLRLAFNTGAAFSTGTGLGPFLGAAAIGICCVLAYMVWHSSPGLQAILLGGVLGGAVGNIADRIFRADDGLLSGAVIDFIDFGWWPVFNVADMAVVGGVIGLMALALLTPEPVDVDPGGDEGPDSDSTNGSAPTEQPA